MSLKISVSQSRPKVFTGKDGRPTKIWLDPRLPNRPDLVALIEQHGAIFSLDYADSSTTIMILHPASINIFDRYCHPTWLPVGREREGTDEWRRKVIVTNAWPGKCIAVGRMLGLEDDWGGCRKGGPPKSIPIPLDRPTVPTVSIPTGPSSFRSAATLPKAAHSLGPSSKVEAIASSSTIKPKPTGISVARALSGATTEPKMKSTAQASGSTPLRSPTFPKSLNSSTKQGSTSSSHRGPAAMRLAHFANLPPGRNDEIHRQMTSETVDRILRSAHLLSFQPGQGYKDVMSHVSKKHPDLAYTTWKKKYVVWRKREGEMGHATDEFTLSKYSHIFPKYLALVIAGRPLEKIAAKLSERQSDYGLSEADWSVLFSDWLRTTQSPKTVEKETTGKGEAEKEDAEEEEGGPASGSFYVKGSDIAFDTQGQADRYAARVRIARIYKKNFNSWDFGASEVGKRAYKVTNLSESTTTSYYLLWRKGDTFFEMIPEKYKFSGGPQPAAPSVPDQKAETAVMSSPSRKMQPNEKMPLATLDDVIRDAHLVSVQHDDIKYGLHYLIDNYKEYSSQTWPTHYRDWRNRTRRFATIPYNDNFTQYSTIFHSLLPLVKKGMSLDDISKKLAKEQTKYRHSTMVWNQLFGNWLRTVSEAIKQNTSGGATEENQRLARAKRLELASVFKRDYDSMSFTCSEVVRVVSSNHSLGYVDGQYRRWRKQNPAFDFLPENLKCSESTGADQDTTNESRKRSRSVSSASSESSNKRGRLDADWMEAEVMDLCGSDESDRESMFSS